MKDHAAHILKQVDHLKSLLRRIDGRGYKAYKELKGSYDFGGFTLIIDHVQGDPFAQPSRMRIRVSQGVARFPADTFSGKSREIALRDFLTRQFYRAARQFARGGRGTGKSGLITIDRPGQEVLERSSALVTSDTVEARFQFALPAFGRSIAGKDAADMFFHELPRIVTSSLLFQNLNEKDLYAHVETAEDADALRDQLQPRGLIAFVADGAILPRASGIDQRPLTRGTVIPFASPEALRVELEAPNRGLICGMGVRKGITLIVGGGYHGKSTLLTAMELGVYNHLPGDGREYVVTSARAVKIRAEDGRRIEKVNISPFISNLPFGQPTEAFSTEDASGSTSQAANIMEALEVGAEAFLLDEDTSATNFMIRDHRMQELISSDREPITPFIDKVSQLYDDHGVSTILVMGGSGDYFDVAHTVIGMDEYRAKDLTKEAQSIARRCVTARTGEGGQEFGTATPRFPIKKSFDASRGKREVKITPRGLQSISFGEYTIDLGAIEQLVEVSQTRAIGDAIQYATQYMNDDRTLRDLINLVMSDLAARGLDVLFPYPTGEYAAFRGYELAAAINRLRTLKVKTAGSDNNAISAPQQRKSSH